MVDVLMKNEEKINVLFVIIQMKMGGSERLVCDLVRNVDRDLFNPHVAWFYEEKPLKEFSDLDIPLFYVPKVKRFDFATMRRIGRIIKENGIHVVNAHHFLSMVYSFYGAKIVNNARLVYTEHSEWEIQAISGKWLVAGRNLLRYTDAVVGISNNVRDCLQDIFNLPENKTHAIANGVDSNLFSVALNKKDYKIKYGLDDKDIVIGIVANLKKNKNHIFLLKSFKKLLRQNNSLKLLIIGQGFKDDPEGSEDDIRTFISETGIDDNVLLMGGRSDVPDLLKAMDIFCLVSYKEGLPISLTEAMATGLPVVGTDVEGIKDVIVPNKNGFLVPLNDEEKLTQVLHQLIEYNSLRQEMGLESRRLAEQYYALENCVKQYQLLYS